ncbi:MAG: class I SAM-dependent methyltransferase [Ferruginibacter sp.]
MANRQMDKMYVQQYDQLENNHWWFIIRQKIILQTLRKFTPPLHPGGLKILNVGAAAGASSKWLASLGDVVSLENDPLFLDCLINRNLKAINASITDIPLDDDSVDLVCAFDVIEHVENDQQAVEELVRVCKPGGNICITVPAFQTLWGNHDVVNGHKRRYTRKHLQNLIDGQRATIQYSSYFNTILFIPVLLFRKIQPLFKNNRQQHNSDFNYFKTNIILNNVLKVVFGIELYLLRSVKFPFGVSLMMLIQKKPASKDISK